MNFCLISKDHIDRAQIIIICMYTSIQGVRELNVKPKQSDSINCNYQETIEKNSFKVMLLDLKLSFGFYFLLEFFIMRLS